MANFLTVDGFHGKSMNPQYPNAFAVLSYDFGSPTPRSGREAREFQLHDLRCVFGPDRPLSRFYLAATSGQHLKKMILVSLKPGEGASKPSEIFRWTFTDVLVATYREAPSWSTAATEIGFLFAKIETFFGVVPPPQETVLPEHRQLLNHQKSLLQQQLLKAGSKS